MCRLSGAQSVKWVSYLEEEERWFKTLEDWELIEDDVEEVGAIIEIVGPIPKLIENMPIEEIVKFYNSEECLHICIGICPLSHKVYEATQKIPEELWKTESYHFIPGCQGLSIEIVYHDLFEVPSDPSGVIRNVFLLGSF